MEGRAVLHRGSAFKNYLELTKPRLTGLSVISGLAGEALARDRLQLSMDSLLLACGLFALGAGSNAFNQLMESRHDAVMARTRSRPIPEGRVAPGQALIFACACSALGMAVLASTNAMAAWLGLATLLSYTLVYTPLKRLTSLCTLVGAIPGALPPLVGYVAVTGALHEEALALATILFMWQMPHFFAISWRYRQDYSDGGFPMISVIDNDRGSMTVRQNVVYTFALMCASLLPSVLGHAGLIYFMGALALGVVFITFSASIFITGMNARTARRLFVYSIVYLVLLLGLLVMDPVL